MNAVQFFVQIFADLIIAVLLIRQLGGQFMIGQKIAKNEQDNQSRIEAMKDYREWNSWDTKKVRSPDVISAILEYRGDPKIEINSKGATADNNWKRSQDPPKVYTEANTKDTDIATIYTDFEDPTLQYISKIERNENGVVTVIHFIKQYD